MSTKFCPLHGSYDKSNEMCPTCRLNNQATVPDFTAKLDIHSKSWTFPFATALHLNRIFAEVHVIPTNSSQIKVVIKGDSELIKAAELSTQDVAVIIKAPIPFKPGTYIPHNVNQPFINIGGKTYTSIQSVSFVSSGQIIIDNREVDQDRKLKLTVEVPHNITLTLRGLLWYLSYRQGRWFSYHQQEPRIGICRVNTKPSSEQ